MGRRKERLEHAQTRASELADDLLSDIKDAGARIADEAEEVFGESKRAARKAQRKLKRRIRKAERKAESKAKKAYRKAERKAGKARAKAERKIDKAGSTLS